MEYERSPRSKCLNILYIIILIFMFTNLYFKNGQALAGNTLTLTSPARPIIDSKFNNYSTNNARISISGSAAKDSTIIIVIDNNSYTSPTRVDALGKWSYTHAAELSEGAHVIYAKAVDSLGNISDESNIVTIIVDHIAPPAPLIDPSFNDGNLNSNRPIVFGKAEPMTKVYVAIDGVEGNTTAIADGNGNWKYATSLSLGEGYHRLKARVVDAAGNASVYSSEMSFNIDSIPPRAPIITVPINNYITNNPRPVVSGSAEVGSKVILAIDGKDIASAINADAFGNWSYAFLYNISSGNHNVTAKAKDNFNNISPASKPIVINVKTAPPKAPIIDKALNNSATRIRKLTISGTAELGTKITLNIDGAVYQYAYTDAKGKWSYTADSLLNDGKHIIIAYATDMFNNPGAASSQTIITVDTVPPSSATIDSSFDNGVINSTRPTIYGNGEPGATITVIIDGIEGTKATFVDAKGNWKYDATTALTEGRHYAFVKINDSAGNMGPISKVVYFNVDVTKPRVPTISSPSTEALINTGRPTIQGTSEPNEKILIYLDGIEQKSFGLSDNYGNWSYNFSENLKDGKHNIFAKAKNSANNLSQGSKPISLIIDTAPPQKPVILNPINNLKTNMQRIVINGTAEKGSKITIKIDGQEMIDCATTDSMGKWVYSYPEILNQGKHTLVARAKDIANNIGGQSAPVLFTIDLVPPIVTINELGNEGYVSIQTPELSGTVKPNSKVFLSIDGNEIKSYISADVSGNWRYRLEEKLLEGEHSVSGRAQDPAGNIGAIENVIKFVVDMTPPTRPMFQSPIREINSNNLSDEINGSAEPNSTIILEIDGIASTSSISVDSKGEWSANLNGISEGKHIIGFRAIDRAGNLGPLSDTININYDKTPPNAPILSKSSNIRITDQGLEITGAGDLNSTILIWLDGKLLKQTAMASKNGKFSINLGKNISMSNHVITAAAKDEIGNISLSSAPLLLTAKQFIPSKPTILKPLNNLKTKEKKPTISGTADAGTSILLTITSGSGTMRLTTKANNKGLWTAKLKASLKPGRYKISVVSRNSHNLSSQINSRVINILK